MKKIENFFFKNIFAKFTCILLAIVLWIYVGTGQTRIADFPGSIPLQIKNVPQGLVAVSDTENITVKVVADNNIFKQLTSESFNANIDLVGYKQGTYNVKPNVTVSVANVAIVEVNPALVTLSLETSIEKEVPVAVSVSGNAGVGLVAGATQVDPANVTVSGARSVVGSILEATAKIELTGQTSDFKQMVKLVALDPKGKEIKGVTFSPSEVIVNVAIVKASNVKTVGIKVNINGNPAQGYWITEIQTEPRTVTITAAEASIGSISYIETKPVEVGNLTKNTDLTTTLAPPSGVTILDKIDQIKVSVTIGKNQATKEIDAGFAWHGLATNLKVTSAEPTTVKVVVTGPQDSLSNLSAGDVLINVDLSGYNQPGTYSIDISRSSISGPSGISTSSIVPSAINVRLDTK